jgi:hypothetical protein
LPLLGRGGGYRGCDRRYEGEGIVTPVLELFLSCCCSLQIELNEKCSACRAISSELGSTMKNEVLSGDIDLRNRFDSKGVRQGKTVDYAMR